MESVNTKVQTGLRLDPDLYNRLKIKAKKQKRSFNSYVETILEAAAGAEYPSLGKGFKVSDEILSLGNTLPHYSEEEIAIILKKKSPRMNGCLTCYPNESIS